MGALTGHRKRKVDYFVSFANPIDQSSGHYSKKPKPSVSTHQNTQDLANSIADRIRRYPDTKSVARKVHAPVSNTRFSHSSSVKSTEIAASSRESPADKMGRFSLVSRFLGVNNWKFSRYFSGKQKEKEVIEVGNEDNIRDGVSDKSSVEEVKNEYSVGNKWKERQGVVDNSQEVNAKPVGADGRSLDSSAITDASNAIPKVDDGEKKGLLLLNQLSNDNRVPPYRRRYESAKKRDGKLANIESDIELTEKRLKGLLLLRPLKKKELIKKDVAKECFVPLTEDEAIEVSCALSNTNRRKVLVAHESIDITVEKLQCLRPRAWLNDEVINLYLELLKEREKREPQKFLKCHFFNTFFYKKLISGEGGYNFKSVRRWTTQRKLGYSLLECDKIFVPIHHKIHWCLAIINKKEQKFQYLDSLKGIDNQVLDVLARYFVDEVKDKCEKDIDVSSWEQEFVTELPEQENGYDCGMFMIKYTDFYSRDVGLCFQQDHMPYFRLRTAKEILKLRAD